MDVNKDLTRLYFLHDAVNAEPSRFDEFIQILKDRGVSAPLDAGLKRFREKMLEGCSIWDAMIAGQRIIVAMY